MPVSDVWHPTRAFLLHSCLKLWCPSSTPQFIHPVHVSVWCRMLHTDSITHLLPTSLWCLALYKPNIPHFIHVSGSDVRPALQSLFSSCMLVCDIRLPPLPPIHPLSITHFSCMSVSNGGHSTISFNSFMPQTLMSPWHSTHASLWCRAFHHTTYLIWARYFFLVRHY